MAEQKPGATGDDDMHRRFREALRRKKDTEHTSAGPSGRDGKGVGPSQREGGKRQFRRKSG
jgi:hypothetical protein